MATIVCCKIKNEKMDKVRTVFEGVVIIGLLLFVDITALYQFLKGLCNSNWIASNVIVCLIIEMVLCVWIFNHIRRGSVEILRETRDLEMLKALYLRIKYYTFLGIFFGLWQLCKGLGIFAIPENNAGWQVMYACNILGVSLFFFLWMHFSIKEIKRRQEF